VVSLVDSAGQVLNSYQYDAFGDTANYAEKVANRFMYAGEQFDKITGQYYLRARYYNPVVGRFTQEDTYRGDGLNLYAYVANNPIMFIDPTGHMNYRTQLDDLVLGYWEGISEVQKEFDYSKKSLSDVIKSAKSTIDFYKSLYNLGKDLYKNNIGWDELSKILGDAATDALIGDILYIKDNYEILKCGVEATDEEVYEFGRRTPHAIVELATIGYTVNKVANLTKAFIKGTSNSILKNIKGLDDLISNPSKLKGVSPDELYKYLKDNGYNPQPLGGGSLKGVHFEEGGGFKVNWGGDRILQYHPAGGHHGGVEYWKLSSGLTGTKRYDMFGNLID